jgi:hypothetical protein
VTKGAVLNSKNPGKLLCLSKAPPKRTVHKILINISVIVARQIACAPEQHVINHRAFRDF